MIDNNSLKGTLKEIQYMEHLKHKNIIRVLSYFQFFLLQIFDPYTTIMGEQRKLVDDRPPE